MEVQLKTVLENKTKYNLELKQWTRNGNVPIVLVKPSSRHTMSHNVDWTFQDYMIEPKHYTTKHCLKLSINSDMCCDNERIIVKESVDGKLVAEEEARRASSPQRWFWSRLSSCLKSKHDVTEDQSKLSTYSVDCCGFSKIYRSSKKAVDKVTHKPSRLCGEDGSFDNLDDCNGFEKIYKPLKKAVHEVTHKPRLCGEHAGFSYIYHQLIPFFVDGSLHRCVETLRNLVKKRSKQTPPP